MERKGDVYLTVGKGPNRGVGVMEGLHVSSLGGRGGYIFVIHGRKTWQKYGGWSTLDQWEVPDGCVL